MGIMLLYEHSYIGNPLQWWDTMNEKICTANPACIFINNIIMLTTNKDTLQMIVYI